MPPDVICPQLSITEATMTGISLSLPEDMSNSFADLAMDVLRDYIEQENGTKGTDLFIRHDIGF